MRSERDEASAQSGIASLLVRIPPDVVDIVNALSRRREPLACRWDSRSLKVRVSVLEQAIDQPLRFAATVGPERISIDLPPDFAARMADAIDLGAPLNDELPPQRALLAEFALLDLVTRLEALLEQSIQILPADEGMTSAPLSLGISVGFDDGTQAACALHLGAALASRLVAELDRITPAKPLDFEDLPVAVSLRAGVQTLTLGDVESLVLGDIVMLDTPAAHACVHDRLVAPIEKTADGFRLTSPLERPRNRMLQEDDPMMDDERDEKGLESMPVQLALEFGRIEMALGELRALAPGSVLPFSHTLEDAVHIVANGRRIGRGNLVTIGDGLGVRITRLTANE